MRLRFLASAWHQQPQALPGRLCQLLVTLQVFSNQLSLVNLEFRLKLLSLSSWHVVGNVLTDRLLGRAGDAGMERPFRLWQPCQ